MHAPRPRPAISQAQAPRRNSPEIASRANRRVLKQSALVCLSNVPPCEEGTHVGRLRKSDLLDRHRWRPDARQATARGVQHRGRQALPPLRAANPDQHHAQRGRHLCSLRRHRHTFFGHAVGGDECRLGDALQPDQARHLPAPQREQHGAGASGNAARIGAVEAVGEVLVDTVPKGLEGLAGRRRLPFLHCQGSEPNHAATAAERRCTTRAIATCSRLPAKRPLKGI
mmetsp:Transcript_163678/g.524891  ORF Transcript_163678/g.524891 Transcript_163678/m.524891 type:complete len:227 (+) Transcript_163678:158-838(+)